MRRRVRRQRGGRGRRRFQNGSRRHWHSIPSHTHQDAWGDDVTPWGPSQTGANQHGSIGTVGGRQMGGPGSNLPSPWDGSNGTVRRQQGGRGRRRYQEGSHGHEMGHAHHAGNWSHNHSMQHYHAGSSDPAVSTYGDGQYQMDNTGTYWLNNEYGAPIVITGGVNVTTGSYSSGQSDVPGMHSHGGGTAGRLGRSLGPAGLQRQRGGRIRRQGGGGADSNLPKPWNNH